jgi:outer membrane protein assembly complex protein YaeT
MPWRPVVLIVAAGFAVSPGSASAQPLPIDALLGRPITSVVAAGERAPVTAPDVLALIDTHVGAPLAMVDVRESVIHLSSIGRFDRVDVEGRADGAGVAVTYRLVETRRVARVDLRGNLAVAKRRIRQALGNRVNGVPTPDRLASGDRAIRALYESLGYFDVRISSTLQDQPNPIRSRLVYTIDAGPRATIGRIDVTASGVSQDEVLTRLRLTSGQPWDAPRLEERAQRLTTTLREQGHYEASITWGIQRRDGAGIVDITVDAVAGPLVDLVFDSPEVPARRLREFVPIAREGAVDEDLLEDSKRRIEIWLHGEGYARATADYERTELQDRLQVTFRVRRGPLFQVQDVDIDGVEAGRLAEVRPLVPLERGAPYSEETLANGAAAILQYYQVRGFASARVETALTEMAGSDQPTLHVVRPRIIVQEGDRTVVSRILINGAVHEPEPSLRGLIGLRPGTAFYPPQVIADRNAVTAYYLNRGYRDVRVDVIPRASTEPNAIDVSFEITEGEQFTVGHVLIAGNTRTSTATITREVGLTPGAPLGVEDLTGAQQRLNALGLFRRVSVDELPKPGHRVTDVAINVDEAPVTNIDYGIGLEGGRRLVRDPSSDAAVEKVEIAPRGSFTIGRRNLWGKNRSVTLFTRFSLRDRGGSEAEPESDASAFYEFRVVGNYREPRVFGTTADAQVNGFVEQGVRSSFNFARQGVSAETARRLTPRLTAVGRYTFGKTRLFDQRVAADEKPAIDRLFPQVRLSTLSAVLVHDTRNDPLDPSTGYIANMETDFAMRVIGSEVGFIKTFVQGLVYRRVPSARRVIVAAGTRLGLATGFASVQTPSGGESQNIKDLPASERFYAGGSTTVRGYALDRLGDDATIDSDGFPRGGNALVIFNAELRFPVWGSFGGVTFLDAGNVFARVADFDLSRIKPAVGAGVRYRSPIGPIRVDVGFKLDPREFGNGEREGRWEFHVSLGQAF